VARNESGPGCRGQREPAQPPGQPKGWSDPPPIDLRALAFARSSHRPSCSKARRAMPVFGRRPGRPDPLPFDTVHRSPGVRSPSEPAVGEPTPRPESSARSAGYPAPSRSWPCRRFPGGCAAPTPSAGEPAFVAGVEARSVGEPTPLLLDAVHADPAEPCPRCGAAGLRPPEQLGCSFGLGPVCCARRRPVKPVTRYNSE